VAKKAAPTPRLDFPIFTSAPQTFALTNSEIETILLSLNLLGFSAFLYIMLSNKGDS
jgi:hypothetical protein